MKLINKVAVVTGGGSGIGRGIAMKLFDAGASVVIADVDKKGGNETASMITEKGGKAIFVKTNIADENDVTALFEKISKTFDDVDILVNNAGISIGGDILELPVKAWDTVMSVNVRGTFLCTKAALPAMIKKKGGAIINIASCVVVGVGPKNPCYAASKGAVMSFTQSVALDYAQHNIRVNAIHPGQIATPLSKREGETLESQLERQISKQPLPKGGLPEDIGNAVVFLSSDDAAFITGTALTVDGGLTLQSLVSIME